MPSAMDESEDSKPSASSPKPSAPSPKRASIEVKQLQRYYTVLRDFMAHLHKKTDIYPPNHEFTQDELASVTPQDIILWMNVKLYNKEDPKDGDMPLNGSHHTLDYYKKSISYFMPQKEVSWDPAGKMGNPTRSNQVNNLIKKIKDWDETTGGVRKRKATAAPPARTPPNSGRPFTHNPGAKIGGFAPLPANQQPPPAAPFLNPNSDRAAIQGILGRMHAQNASFVHFFNTMSATMIQFKSTIEQENNTIMSEINRINALPPMPPPPGPGARTPVSRAPASEVSTGMLDWQYVHADGIRRRVPPTWQFPHSNLQEMYILWHCGDYQNRISPLKLFDNNDVSFLGKRARMNLNEVKNLMATIDEEATKKGTAPGPTMTLNEASKCFQAGLSGFNFSSTTPTGKTRNILRLKWSTLTKYNNKAAPTEEDQEKLAEEEEEKARGEFVVPTVNEVANDNFWYEHDDEEKRRVPSTWKFPMLGLEDMYTLWHCGDEENKISPMKQFTAKDVSHIKRSKTNLSEVRSVMTVIDLEAVKKGLEIKTVMTPDEAKECCRVGHLGLNIPTETSEGRTRTVLHMKWSSAVRLKDPDGKKAAAGDGPEAMETELPEADVDV